MKVKEQNKRFDLDLTLCTAGILEVLVNAGICSEKEPSFVQVNFLGPVINAMLLFFTIITRGTCHQPSN